MYPRESLRKNDTSDGLNRKKSSAQTKYQSLNRNPECHYPRMTRSEQASQFLSDFTSWIKDNGIVLKLYGKDKQSIQTLIAIYKTVVIGQELPLHHAAFLKKAIGESHNYAREVKVLTIHYERMDFKNWLKLNHIREVSPPDVPRIFSTYNAWRTNGKYLPEDLEFLKTLSGNYNKDHCSTEPEVASIEYSLEEYNYKSLERDIENEIRRVADHCEEGDSAFKPGIGDLTMRTTSVSTDISNDHIFESPTKECLRKNGFGKENNDIITPLDIEESYKTLDVAFAEKDTLTIAFLSKRISSYYV